jgi:uncharacterized protein YjbI with pentapeptide repeats
VNLNGANLSKANLCEANLTSADLNNSNLYLAEMKGAQLIGATIRNADLGGAKLCKANLSGSDIRWSNISEADLSGANLSGAHLEGSNLSETNFEDTNLSGCRIYAISAWNLRTNKNTDQSNLVITRSDESTITVDDIEVAQFIYLLLNNQKLRGVIDTIGEKAVLILGRFTEERKAVLDALRKKLRELNYLPILFDFEKPSGKNITETVSTLAHLSRFVLADITDAKGIPHELERIIPINPSLPVQPLILSSQYEYSMFKDFLDYSWVLLPHRYETVERLLSSLEEVITPAIEKAEEIRQRRKVIEEHLAKGINH